MMKIAEGETVANLLTVVADLLRGDRHSRRTIAKATGKSLPTADRWIEQIEMLLPNVRRVRDGKTTWIVHEGRRPPSRSAAVGACIAASLGSIFEGSAQERGLKDARDYILQERGDTNRDLERKFILAPRGGEYALPEAGPSLDSIVDALVQGTLLTFEYTHNDGTKITPTIAPLSLVLFDHQFYILASRGEGFYPYRFARMARIQKLDEKFEYPPKGEYDPKGLLAQGFGIHTYSTGPVEDIEVVLSEPWASYALTHRWHPSQRATRTDQGVRVKLQARMCRELQTWALGFGEHARVIQPEQLRSAVASRLRKAADVYGPHDDRPSVAKARQSKLQPRRKVK